MSDTDTAPTEGAIATPAANGAEDTDSMPQVGVIVQFIKDMSVENPNSPAVYQWQDQPQLDVQFNINVNRVNDDIHEVVLKIAVKATSPQGTLYVVDLAYGGLFGLRNVPEDALPPFMLIEAPRLLFPFARQIVAEQITNLGFPPLLLEPIDFGAAYMQQLDAQAQAAGTQPGNA
ncbi:protein-export chaperone SecB [Sphingomonas sp. ASV193]|uniref:protein-export chaperone SecB n=1 Tax=Sphingomonas sp. ASV193 TaxID=3144405 RepID=UPI0032E8DD00